VTVFFCFCFNAFSLNSHITKSKTTVSYVKDVFYMSAVHFDAVVYTHNEIYRAPSQNFDTDIVGVATRTVAMVLKTAPQT
jgi:hypothetical protein